MMYIHVYIAILKWTFERVWLAAANVRAYMRAKNARKDGMDAIGENEVEAVSVLASISLHDRIQLLRTLRSLYVLCVYTYTHTTIYVAKREKAGKNCQG